MVEGFFFFGREGLDSLGANFVENAVDFFRDFERRALVLADDFGVLCFLRARGCFLRADLGEFDHGVFEGWRFEDCEAKDCSAEVAGAATGIMPIKDDGTAFVDEVDDAEGAHLKRDHKEK